MPVIHAPVAVASGLSIMMSATVEVNVAVTDLLASIVSVSGLAAPLADPDHPLNAQPSRGSA